VQVISNRLPVPFLERILSFAKEKDASDVYLQAHEHPILQIANESTIFPGLTEKVSPDDLRQIVDETVKPSKYLSETFHRDLNVHFSHVIPGVGRYRFQVGYQRSNLDISIRRLLDDIPTMPNLNLPENDIKDICDFPNGLVLIAGSMNQGKSTTLASIVDYIISTKRGKRVTIVESPREFYFINKLSFVKQREIGTDILSYSDAARCALRENTNILVFGETFDAPTVRALLSAANSSLVFTTLHAGSASAAINKLIYTLPDIEREESRLTLSRELRAVLYQTLVKRRDETLWPCLEILRNNPTVASLIRNKETTEQGKPYKIDQYLDDHGLSDQMKSLQYALQELAERDIISIEEAIRHAPRKRDMQLHLVDGFTAGLGDSSPVSVEA
jgi:twitching motility protein PilT